MAGLKAIEQMRGWPIRAQKEQAERLGSDSRSELTPCGCPNSSGGYRPPRVAVRPRPRYNASTSNAGRLSGAMRIEVVSAVTTELVEAFARLLPQHSVDARLPTAEQLTEVISAPGNTLLIARNDKGAIVGTLTLVVYPTPGAILGYFEDVVVDEPARGQRIGEALVREGLRIAAACGAVKTDLLSGDHRQAAIRLYQRVGFKRVDTNAWRYMHDQPSLA